MASSFVVADILADVARSANCPAFATDTNVTLAQATYWLAQSARSLSALYKQHFGDDRDYLRTATLATQPALGMVSLPADCGEVCAVLWVRTASDWRLLEGSQLDDLELGQVTLLRPWISTGEPTYRIEGETLGFYPASSVAETVVLFYNKHLDTTAQTSITGRLDTDRWLTLDLVCRVLSAQGRDGSAYLQDKMLLEKNLFSVERNRDRGAIHTIRDVRGRRADRGYRDRWGR